MTRVISFALVDMYSRELSVLLWWTYIAGRLLWCLGMGIKSSKRGKIDGFILRHCREHVHELYARKSC